MVRPYSRFNGDAALSLLILLCMAATFTPDNFEKEVLQSDKLVLVDFWAPWCGPCRAMGPVIDELADEYEDSEIKIGKLNVDESQTIATQFGIMSIPTIIIFKNGAAVDQMTGMQTKESLKAKLSELATS